MGKKARFKKGQIVYIKVYAAFDMIEERFWASSPADNKPRWRYKIGGLWYDPSELRPLTKKERGQ